MCFPRSVLEENKHYLIENLSIKYTHVLCPGLIRKQKLNKLTANTKVGPIFGLV